MPLSKIPANGISAIANTAISGNIISSQITSVSNTQISGNIISSQITSVANTQITGLIANTQIANVSNTKIVGLITATQLANTAVTAGIYGGANNSASITVDAQGRVTSVSNVAWTSTAITASPIPTINVLTSGSGTWTIPAGVTKVKVTVVGGGGNSSGGLYGYSVSGGAGGGTAIKWLSGLTPGKTLDYTVGAATAASQVVTGASNGQTITSIVGSAGSAGTSGGSGSGDGGSASGGDLNIAGQRALGLSADGAVYGGGSHFAAAQFNVNTAGNIPGGGAGPQSSGSTISGARGVIIFEY
jgi:hypothetical protein